MRKKIILISAFFMIIFLSLPAISAQWSHCKVDNVAISALSGNYYVKLTYISGGTAWTGSRNFRINPDVANQMMAVCLTAQSNGTEVIVWLADVAENSLVNSIYSTNVSAD